MTARQLPGVRVPIPIVILLCLCVIGGVWWTGTRKHDFLSPAPENQMLLAKEKAGDSTHSKEHPRDVVAPQEKPAKQPQEDPPQLADYRNQSMSDPALLIETARQLETHGKLQRSLLAWERILDSAAPDEARTAEALQAIKRLRPELPEWNTDSTRTIAITLHAGTGKSTAEILTPVLEDIARELELASSGILKISTSVTAGIDTPKSRGPAPIALWLAGPGADARSTEVRAFTVGQDEALMDKVLKNLLQIFRSNLARTASLQIPESSAADEIPLEAIQLRITRLGWHELGSQLNKTLE